jgi:hypothetical protein
MAFGAFVAISGCSGDSASPSSPTTSPPSSPIAGPALAQQETAATCAIVGNAAPAGCWLEVLSPGHGGFPNNPGSNDAPKWAPGRFPMTMPPKVAFNNELWMTGQTVAYSSRDGLTWAEHTKTDWGGRIYHGVVFFKEKLWMYGGLDYDGRVFLNDVWSSSDGLTWRRTGNAQWSPRSTQSLVVFRGRLWLFGGANHIASDRSTDGFLNDVWSSDDGTNWTQVTAAAPWSVRDSAAVVVLNDSLYLLGGQDKADIWKSSDGQSWTELTAEAEWKPRNDFARMAFDGKLWVFGGWTGKSTNALNDVWFSTDGVKWQRQAEHAPWAPRFPVAIVFQDRIWIYSGKHTGANDSWGGDLWQMTARPRA